MSARLTVASATTTMNMKNINALAHDETGREKNSNSQKGNNKFQVSVNLPKALDNNSNCTNSRGNSYNSNISSSKILFVRTGTVMTVVHLPCVCAFVAKELTMTSDHRTTLGINGIIIKVRDSGRTRT